MQNIYNQFSPFDYSQPGFLYQVIAEETGDIDRTGILPTSYRKISGNAMRVRQLSGLFHLARMGAIYKPVRAK